MTTKNILPRVHAIIKEARGFVSREEIVARLNSGNLPGSTENDVNVAISRIRRKFGRESVVTLFGDQYVDGLYYLTSDRGRKK